MKLVPPCVLTWLTLPYSPPAKGLNHYNETIPEEVAKVFDALFSSSAPHSHVRVSIGSCSNDRALAIPGPHFNSMLALIEHVQNMRSPSLMNSRGIFIDVFVETCRFQADFAGTIGSSLPTLKEHHATSHAPRRY